MDNNLTIRKPKPKLGERLLDLIFPRFCVGCRQEGSYLCPTCRRQIIQIKTTTCLKCQRINEKGICPKCRKDLPFNRIIVFGYHRDPILKEAIHQLKYEGITELSQILAELLISQLKDISFPLNSLLVPIPLHRARRQNRGYNQSELITKIITDRLKLPLDTKLIKRIKSTQPQINLKHEARLANMAGAFQVNSHLGLSKHTIILFDDVVTTGSTAAECAKTLRQAGAKKIWLITLAHG